MRSRTLVLLCALLAATAASRPAVANDSQAALGIGGLTLVKSADIRMDSEDLFISEQRITVDYVFTNTSAQDIETLVAFPLPDVENGLEVPTYDYVGELDFRTTVDGKPAELQLVQTARFKGRDVTARLARVGVSPMPLYPNRFDKTINALPEPERAALVAEGLIEDDGSIGAEKSWTAHWTTTTAVTRRQVFPAGRSIAVSHSYKPFVGGSVGGRFDPEYRRDAEFPAIRRKFCVDDTFLKGMDRRIAEARKTNASYGETWISYVLTSGANWKGPIGRFRMVVDKGDPDALVSFCATGVKKIDKTRFEVVYQNFVPRQDVDVTIVKFFRP